MESVAERTKVAVKIMPQPGGQEAFAATSADIAVCGGKAGGGKTFALLMEPLRHIHNPEFGAVIFRRTCPQITNEGGLWDTSMKLYPHYPISGVPKLSPRTGNLQWFFPSGARVRFAHMQHEKDRLDWDGAQIPLIAFDQLEHFTWRQFSYMISRNRSECGVIPYMRATCNPAVDHWLRQFMSWWIDDETGLAIEKRGGVLRWFVIIDDKVCWGDSKAELKRRFGKGTEPKSFTFIPAHLEENKILLRENPQYKANLQALCLVDRERLERGNWNARETAGMFFRREWFEIVNAAPALVDEVRYWDRAATEAKPDRPARASWTCGARMGKDSRGVFYITDMNRFQGSPLTVETTINNIASQDVGRVRIGLEQDPGQAGKAEVEALARKLAGYIVVINPVRESKGTRAKSVSAQAEAGNVKLVRGPWNEDFLREAVNFDGSDKCASDQIDAVSGAFHVLTAAKRAGTWSW